jgi:hypothetical protein
MASSNQKYRVDVSKRKRFKKPMFKKVVTYIVNDAEVEKFLKRNKRLPDHVCPIEASDEQK